VAQPSARLNTVLQMNLLWGSPGSAGPVVVIGVPASQALAGSFVVYIWLCCLQPLQLLVSELFRFVKVLQEAEHSCKLCPGFTYYLPMWQHTWF
jgi:hypothetical protein